MSVLAAGLGVSIEGEIAGFVLAVVCASICIMRSGIVLCFLAAWLRPSILLINGCYRCSFSRLLGLSIASRLPFDRLSIISCLFLASLRPMTSKQVYTLYIVFSFSDFS